jgi:hypothetical protein
MERRRALVECCVFVWLGQGREYECEKTKE